MKQIFCLLLLTIICNCNAASPSPNKAQCSHLKCKLIQTNQVNSEDNNQRNEISLTREKRQAFRTWGGKRFESDALDESNNLHQTEGNNVSGNSKKKSKTFVAWGGKRSLPLDDVNDAQQNLVNRIQNELIKEHNNEVNWPSALKRFRAWGGKRNEKPFRTWGGKRSLSNAQANPMLPRIIASDLLAKLYNYVNAAADLYNKNLDEENLTRFDFYINN